MILKEKSYIYVKKLLNDIEAVDKILRTVAGSENIESKKKIFENRQKFMHNQAYVPITLTIKTIQKMTEAKFKSGDERIDFH